MDVFHETFKKKNTKKNQNNYYITIDIELTFIYDISRVTGKSNNSRKYYLDGQTTSQARYSKDTCKKLNCITVFRYKMYVP